MMPSELDERMNELCRRELGARGWTQKKLGDEMGISESEISLLLSRKRRWSRKLIEAFISATDQIVVI